MIYEIQHTRTPGTLAYQSYKITIHGQFFVDSATLFIVYIADDIIYILCIILSGWKTSTRFGPDAACKHALKIKSPFYAPRSYIRKLSP